MDNDRPIRVDDLHDVIEQKIVALVRGMESTNWSTEEVVLAINDVLKARWLDQIDALRKVSRSMPKDFVSDGNEG